MRMRELIDLHEAARRSDRIHLAEALAKTGPIAHGAFTWAARTNRRGATVLKRWLRADRPSTDSAAVEVPGELLPDDSVPSGLRSRDQILIDQFKSFASLVESGLAKARCRADMEVLAGELEVLAARIREWDRDPAK